jgi:hypothetical protein
MRRIVLVMGFGLALAGCESTPRSTTAEGTPGVHALRADADRCAELGLTPGSAEMVECVRAAQATR